MGFAERAADRPIRPARQRSQDEVDALIAAAMTVLTHKGAEELTVADVLAEASLSTRAFYRHFRSKDELLLAIYERDSRHSVERLGRRMEASSPRISLDAWIDETLLLAYDPKRAERTRVLAAEAKRLQGRYPAGFDAIVAAQLAPLVDLLERGRVEGVFPGAEPVTDARLIHALAWAFTEARLHRDDVVSLADARAHVLRFCLPALGAGAEDA
ncbi:MAG: putative transcriptional regulator, TetR family protein [Actinomycetia bacterium]|nr:putative transcriptional regulator, TetR family protein [Actinomycetes bacterium]